MVILQTGDRELAKRTIASRDQQPKHPLDSIKVRLMITPFFNVNNLPAARPHHNFVP